MTVADFWLGSLINIADRGQSVEFYDFLQVNTDSNRSEVTDTAKKDEEEVNQLNAVGQQSKDSASFIDFLSVLEAPNPN